MKRLLTPLFLLLLTAAEALAQADLKVDYVTGSDYLRPGTYQFVVGVANAGSQASAMRIFWQVDNGPVKNALPYTPPALGANTPATGIYSDSFKLTVVNPGTARLKVWVKTLNNVQDANATNDTLTRIIKVMSNLPDKNVVLEVYKHQTCGPCYPAAEFNRQYVEPMSNHSIVALYTMPNDVLYNADAATFNSLYGMAHPAPIFDRYKFPNRSDFPVSYSTTNNNYVLNELGTHDTYYEPLSVRIVGLTLDTPSRLLKVRLQAQAVDTMSGDLRFNVWLTEDSLKGYQTSAPDPNNYWHSHVLRSFVGGLWGKQGSMPASLTAGQTVTYDFQYTIPSTYKLRHLTVIGLVQVYRQDSLQRRIINSTKVKALTKLGFANSTAAPLDVRMFPNPAGKALKLQFGPAVNVAGLEWSIQSMTGQQVLQHAVSDREETIDLSALAPGRYLLSISGTGVTQVMPFVKQ